MAVATNKIIVHITEEDGTAITGAISPIAFRDIDEIESWIEGTHLGDGDWEFDIPTGLTSGLKIGVQTSAGTFTQDSKLSGTLDTAAKLGMALTDKEKVEV